MTKYAKSALDALKRGPMTINEIAFELGVKRGTAYDYVNYLRKCQPPMAHQLGAEVSERTGRPVTIYAAVMQQPQ